MSVETSAVNDKGWSCITLNSALDSVGKMSLKKSKSFQAAAIEKETGQNWNGMQKKSLETKVSSQHFQSLDNSEERRLNSQYKVSSDS